ncbi:GspE/PulE family protein [Caminibacter pacificus]|uniref:General secretion pathway protein E n=1 Tax=Caminibacter pacificus TaxID=1424653 RepID=A0AAJ4RAW7_9BACT|nr:GspE/PulE family protein [Caminibacter pacificus]QCI27409.1 type II/IV secretion system protein [Caminibacter pacificus]ROR38846.1 general secretion pathway protein E [Caminibacter pacificus]
MKSVKNINPKAIELENFNLEEGIKFSLLPALLEDKKVFVTKENDYVDALNYYNKLSIPFEIIMTDEESFNRLLNQYLEVKTKKDLEDNIDEVIEEELSLEDFVKESVDILNSENSAPVIKFVNSMFFQAIKKRASDIHIETHELFGLIRFRIDGVLITQAKIQKKLTELVINRIKVISNLDISEKRVPQDGRCQIKIANKTTDIRVSIIPTYFGEKAVMRILMESEDIPSLKELGFNEEITQGFKELLEHSYGMILVTGPTGSGKSTTLHSFLQTISTPEKNIITVEDPVEYKADNINQIQVNNKVGLTFAKALRSILRQDPDIIMVGEIRDKETATIAIQAALTGHLMLSTLHTNNAAATITRLMDIGIEPFLISSSLIGILSQRLVRKLCDCKTEDSLEEIEKIVKKEPLLQKYEISKIYKPNGCAKCNFTGYVGRKAVGELFIMNDEIKEMIAKGTNDIELKSAMIKHGMKTLKEAIFEEVLNGTTSLKEAIRVGLKD